MRQRLVYNTEGRQDVNTVMVNKHRTSKKTGWPTDTPIDRVGGRPHAETAVKALINIRSWRV